LDRDLSLEPDVLCAHGKCVENINKLTNGIEKGANARELSPAWDYFFKALWWGSAFLPNAKAQGWRKYGLVDLRG
jgi:protein gp37